MRTKSTLLRSKILTGLLSAVLATGAVFTLGTVTASTSYAANCSSDPVTAVRGKDRLCDTPNGRTFTVSQTKVAPGATIEFTGTGFVRDAGGGQTLNIKLNDIDIVASRLEADASGNISGTITLPGKEVFEAYKSQYGAETFWLRVLVGSGRADGQADTPAASLSDSVNVELTVAASASPSPSASPSTTASGSVNVTTEVTKQNTSGTNSAELPKTGIEDSVPWLVVIALGALSLVLIRVSRAKN